VYGHPGVVGGSLCGPPPPAGMLNRLPGRGSAGASRRYVLFLSPAKCAYERYGPRMPSKDEQAARKGKAVEQLIAALCVLATGTELNALTALVDDEGVDLAFKQRDGTRTLDLQVKARFSDEAGSKQLREKQRLVAVVRAATFRVREDFWLLFVAVDARRGVIETAWLVPSDRFDELAGHQVVSGQVRRRFNASAKPDAKDQWRAFRMDGQDLPRRVLGVVRSLEPPPST
jgi:hypothetical protein